MNGKWWLFTLSNSDGDDGEAISYGTQKVQGNILLCIPLQDIRHLDNDEGISRSIINKVGDN